jgi:hypothetical protein
MFQKSSEFLREQFSVHDFSAKASASLNALRLAAQKTAPSPIKP